MWVDHRSLLQTHISGCRAGSPHRKNNNMKLLPISSAVLLAFCCSAQAQEAEAAKPVPVVLISAKLLEAYPYRMESSSDSANLLANTPGYVVAASGGVSGLPIVNGLADDRLKIRIGELEVTSACANHMNPPMSYVDPKQIQTVELASGITPVSEGGDNIGGIISLRTATPLFAKSGAELRKDGSVSLTTRSVNHGVGAGVNASVANDWLSVAYDGAFSRARSFRDGAGNTVLASMYESINHGLTVGARFGAHRLTLRAGTQHIPYEGFPNQYMDMTDNSARHATLAYAGNYGWGELEATVYGQNTAHEMGFFSDERRGTMPMLTEGRNRGATMRATIALSERQLLRTGVEYHAFRLDDFWPAVPGSMMMGPQPYINIADGRRDRVALFGEVVTHHGDAWISQFGLRHESVRSDAGHVQAYSSSMMNMADATAAAAFNARSHRRDDANLDVAATARYQPSSAFDIDFGYGRKARSPNLYERYTWGRGVMAMTMTNWFGDGNGYVGDIDLRPETANTFSFTANWHGKDERWFVKLAPYYNRVNDYIDVDTVGSFNPYQVKTTRGTLLRFANHDATLYGANLSWKTTLGHSPAWGDFSFSGNSALTRGKRNDGGALYRIMPPSTLLVLEQRSGQWTGQLELKAVARKERVDVRRNEPVTAGYALLNAKGAWQWPHGMLLSVGVSNLLDRAYDDPLGGVNLSGLRADKTVLRSLPGAGRSLDVGLSYRF